MNDRIQELERQATETVKCGLNGTSTTESFNRKKFAELIIKKCRDIVSDTRDQAIEDGWKVDEAMSTAMFDIEDYFGLIKTPLRA